MSLRKLFYRLPTGLRFLALKVVYGPGDMLARVTRRQRAMVPPRSMIYTGRGDFIEQGKLHLKYLVKYGNLQNDASVLDVGSGIGRTAIALSGYLTAKGKYEGFDVTRKGVNWCQKNITPQFPNFNFRFVPLGNDLYNDYKQSASTFEFPYQDNEFDLCCLMSVFTHMVPEEIRNYLQQCNNVLRPDGSIVATFFLYDDSLEQKMSVEKLSFEFPVARDRYRLMDPKVQSANVALHISLLKDLAAQSDLKVMQWIRGHWSDGKKLEDNDFQDIVVFKQIG